MEWTAVSTLIFRKGHLPITSSPSHLLTSLLQLSMDSNTPSGQQKRRCSQSDEESAPSHRPNLGPSGRLPGVAELTNPQMQIELEDSAAQGQESSESTAFQPGLSTQNPPRTQHTRNRHELGYFSVPTPGPRPKKRQTLASTTAPSFGEYTTSAHQAPGQPQ